MAKLQANLTDMHTEALELYSHILDLTRTDAIKQWIETLPTYKKLAEEKLKELNLNVESNAGAEGNFGDDVGTNPKGSVAGATKG